MFEFQEQITPTYEDVFFGKRGAESNELDNIFGSFGSCGRPLLLGSLRVKSSSWSHSSNTPPANNAVGLIVSSSI